MFVNFKVIADVMNNTRNMIFVSQPTILSILDLLTGTIFYHICRLTRRRWACAVS